MMELLGEDKICSIEMNSYRREEEGHTCSRRTLAGEPEQGVSCGKHESHQFPGQRRNQCRAGKVGWAELWVQLVPVWGQEVPVRGNQGRVSSVPVIACPPQEGTRSVCSRHWCFWPPSPAGARKGRTDQQQTPECPQPAWGKGDGRFW